MQFNDSNLLDDKELYAFENNFNKQMENLLLTPSTQKQLKSSNRNNNLLQVNRNSGNQKKNDKFIVQNLQMNDIGETLDFDSSKKGDDNYDGLFENNLCGSNFDGFQPPHSFLSNENEHKNTYI